MEFNPFKNFDERTRTGESKATSINPVQIIKNKIESNKLKKEFLKNDPMERNDLPIRAVILQASNIDNYSHTMINLIKKTAQKINFYGGEEELKEKNILNAGHRSYVISEANSKNKYSQEYAECTGVIIVGKDKETGEQISILSHQKPGPILNDETNQFSKDLHKRISEMLNKVDKETMDVVIFGGAIYSSLPKSSLDEYHQSVNLLSQIIEKEINIQPTIMTGPNNRANLSGGPTNTYFDTQKRRLFITRPDQESEMNESYKPTDFEEQSKKWKY